MVWSRAQRQPQQPVEIDRSHPSAAGLMIAWLPIAPSVNLASRKVAFAYTPPTTSGSVFLVAAPGPEKRAKNDGVGNYGIWATTNSGISSDQEFSVLTVQPPWSSRANSVSVSMGSGSGGNGNYYRTWLVNGNTSPVFRGSIFTTFYQQLADTLALSRDEFHSLSVLFSNSVAANKRELWVSGTLGNSSASGVNSYAANFNYVAIAGDSASADYGCDGGVALVLIWTRALFDAEARSLTLNPWQMFAVDTGRRIFLPSASAPVVSLAQYRRIRAQQHLLIR